MKRVAIQLISTGGFYGAERVLVELAKYLADRQWESRVIALEGQGAPELLRRARDFGLSAVAFSEGNRLTIAALVRRLRAELAPHSRTIIHSHGYKGDILLAALRMPRRLSCLATCHSWYSETVKMRLLERLDKWALRGFDHVVAVSDEIRADLIASGMRGEDISRIDNGISVPAPDSAARISIRDEFGIAPHESLVVQIGRLASSKRNDLLLEAVVRAPRAMSIKVLLVGEGDQKERLIAKARSLGIAAQVVICGFRRDVYRIMAAADVLALTSNKEGLPIVVLEAMAIGCPIVSTAVGAVPSILRHDESAWLVPVDDLEALSRALTEVLCDRVRARAVAEKAKQVFYARYEKELMGRQYLDLYTRMWFRRGWN